MIAPRLDIDPLPLDNSPAWLIDEALVKAHCRIDSTDEDANLQLYIRSAIEWVETATHRCVISRAHRLILGSFPCEDRAIIRLPRGLCSAVASIRYYNGGALSTLTGPTSSPVGTGYQEDLLSDSGGVLMPVRGSNWPSVDCDVPAPVRIDFTAGYQPDALPPQILSAILLAVSDAFEMRGTPDYAGLNLADSGKALAAREALISAWRIYRV